MVEDRQEELLKIYDGMRTDALIEIHSEGTLTEDAYEILESVLASRSVPIPKRLNRESKSQEKKTSTLWAIRLASFGAILPVICLALDFEPIALSKICGLCWPFAFFLFAADGHFNLAIYSISITVNAFLWAGLGWLIGYGLSGRK